MQGEVANGVNGGVERSETAHVATTRRGGRGHRGRPSHRGHKGRRADEATGQKHVKDQAKEWPGSGKAFGPFWD